jgi:hypothetical protein
MAFRGKRCATQPQRRLVPSTSLGSQYSSPHHTDGDYRPAPPGMEEYLVEHGQGSLTGYSSMPPMPPTLSQLGITSPGHVEQNYPYKRPISYYLDSETQNPAEIEMLTSR